MPLNAVFNRDGAFLLEKGIRVTPRELWETPSGLEVTDEAIPYWAAIDAATLRITGHINEELRNYKNSELSRIREMEMKELLIGKTSSKRIRTFPVKKRSLS